MRRLKFTSIERPTGSSGERKTTMTTIGKNVKIIAPLSVRAQARSVFELLGAKLITPMETFDVFALEGGGNIGYEYVADAEALTPAQMRNAPWLEIEVADPV